MSCLLFNRSKRPENFEVPGAHGLEDLCAVEALGGPVEDPVTPELDASGLVSLHALDTTGITFGAFFIGSTSV